MRRSLTSLLAALTFATLACNLPQFPADPASVSEAAMPPTAAIASPTALPTPAVSPSPTTAPPTDTPLPSLTPTPFGCETPSDDMTRVTLSGGYVINRRTLSMLEHAQALYGGTHDMVKAVTQGSYNAGVTASFGTHDGGGAVDLSLRDLTNWHHILYEDVDAILLALRRAGFAAWLRDTDVLYPGSPVHLHAIAIGDPELSEAAHSQLTGPEGYFRGNNGLPEDIQPDAHGGPILCPWMIDLGYQDLRP